jgi:hypothetical protein
VILKRKSIIHIFFIEQNVVFVYRIESEGYLTAVDVREKGEWQKYELNQPEQYDQLIIETIEKLHKRQWAGKPSCPLNFTIVYLLQVCFLL